MDGTTKLKRLYEELSDIPERFRNNLGPVLAVPSSKQTRLGEIQLEVSEELAKLPAPKQGNAGEAAVTLDTPSPWHAYFYCLQVQGRTLEADGIHSLFRGQRDSGWTLQPTLWREGVDRELEQRAARCFVSAISGLLDGATGMRFDPATHQATCQHYGIKTAFLDFTADPAVAVAFAAKQSRDDKVRAPKATVLTTRIDHSLDLGARIRFPPPYVERLYKQIGCFLEVPAEMKELPRSTFAEIRFSTDYPHAPFDVRRDRNRVELEPPDPWMASLTHWAYERARDGGDAPVDNHALVQFLTKHGYPGWTQSGGSSEKLVAQWYDHVEDLVHWFALAQQKQGSAMHPHVLAHLVQHNAHILGWWAAMVSLMAGDDEYRRWLCKTVGDVVRQQLGSHSGVTNATS
jgi:hypothetical protein